MSKSPNNLNALNKPYYTTTLIPSFPFSVQEQKKKKTKTEDKKWVYSREKRRGRRFLSMAVLLGEDLFGIYLR